jgi:hypothetical protein
VIDDPFELFDRLLDDRQRDDRGREDAALVAERPLLGHPFVEGMNHGVGRVGIVAQALLHEARQRGEHQRPVDAELVEQLEPRARLAERGQGSDRLAHDLAVRLAVRVAVAEVLLLRAGRGHDVERRVGDVVADLTAHDDLRAAVHLDVVDDAGVGVGDELGQRLTRLVHVVVGVEHREVEHSGRHERSPFAS